MGKYTIGKDLGRLEAEVRALQHRVVHLESLLVNGFHSLKCGTCHKLLAAVDVNRVRLRLQLRKHEGVRKKVYEDTEGNKTIGVGFKLSKAGARDRIEALGLHYDDVVKGSVALTDEQIDKLLADDMEIAYGDCQSVCGNIGVISDVRQRTLIDMAINLGRPKFSGFAKMIAAVKKAIANVGSVVEHEAACSEVAIEMANSKWCNQVGTRCTTLVNMMKTNVDGDFSL